MRHITAADVCCFRGRHMLRASERRLSAVMGYTGHMGYLSPRCAMHGCCLGRQEDWQRAPACLRLLFSAVAERPDSQKLNRARWQLLAVAYSLFSRDVGHTLSCASRSVRVWLGILIAMINSSLEAEPPCTLLRTSPAPLHLTFLAWQTIETAELQKRLGTRLSLEGDPRVDQRWAISASCDSSPQPGRFGSG